jgi:hypothetical protein
MPIFYSLVRDDVWQASLMMELHCHNIYKRFAWNSTINESNHDERYSRSETANQFDFMEHKSAGSSEAEGIATGLKIPTVYGKAGEDDDA